MIECDKVKVKILGEPEKINMNIPKETLIDGGTKVYILNDLQKEIHFEADPQSQLKNCGVDILIKREPDTFVYDIELLNSAGKVIGKGNIDLPVDSVVSDANYSHETKAITLILNNGKNIVIPIGDLITDLVTTEEFEARTQKVYLGSVRSGQEFTINESVINKIFSEYPPVIAVQIANWTTYLKVFDESGDERYFSNNMFYDENETKYLISMVVNKISKKARITKVEEPRMPKPEARDEDKIVVVKNGKYSLELNEKVEVRILPIAKPMITLAEAREIIENYKNYEGVEIHFYTNGENPTNFVAKGWVCADEQFNPRLIYIDGRGKRFEFDTQGFRIISVTQTELKQALMDKESVTRYILTAPEIDDQLRIKQEVAATILSDTAGTYEHCKIEFLVDLGTTTTLAVGYVMGAGSAESKRLVLMYSDAVLISYTTTGNSNPLEAVSKQAMRAMQTASNLATRVAALEAKVK